MRYRNSKSARFAIARLVKLSDRYGKILEIGTTIVDDHCIEAHNSSDVLCPFKEKPWEYPEQCLAQCSLLAY